LDDAVPGSNSRTRFSSNFMPSTGPQSNSSLRDNRAHRGTVGEFLKFEIQPGSHLSFVSAYFTVHAYEALAILRLGATISHRCGKSSTAGVQSDILPAFPILL
jgi:hypothetical protein